MKNKIKNIFKSIGMLLLLLFFSAFFFVIFNIDVNNISDKTYIIYLTLSNFILLGIFIIIYRKVLIEDAKKFFKNFDKNFEISLKYWIIGLVIMIVTNYIITFVLHKTIAGNEEQVRSYIDIMPILMIINTVIYAPFSEELTFRKSFKDVISNKWLYVITSGILFGLAHVITYINNITDLIYIIPYAALGGAFALLYYKTDNIYSSIMMHGLHNLITIVFYLLVGALL